MFEIIKQTVRRLRALFATEPYAIEAKPELVRRTVVTSVLLVLVEGCFILQFYPQRWYFDALTAKSVTDAYQSAGYLIAAGVISMIVFVVMDSIRNDFNQRLYVMWMSAGQRKELSLSTDWHVKNGTGEKEALIRSNIQKIEWVIMQVLFDFIPAGMRILLTSLFLFYLAWPFGVIGLTTLIIYCIVMALLIPRMLKMTKEYVREKEDMEKSGSDLTQNWSVIRGFGMEYEFSERYKAKTLKFWKREVPRHYRWRGCTTLMDSVTLASRCSVLLIGAYLYSTKPLIVTVGVLTLTITQNERLFSNYWKLSDGTVNLLRALESLGKLLSVFETKPSVDEPRFPKWPEQERGGVRFNNVGFTYDNGFAALKNINLEVAPRTVVAIIGKSGSGKTTLMQLLGLSHHPTEGSIEIDGCNLRDMSSLRYRREYIGVVNQQPKLLNDTVINNIRLGSPNAALEEVEEAAKAANAHDFIKKLKDGYDSLIGEDGITLSGGQKQRITIARALLRQPKILILDEATSSLDSESQLLVQRAIDRQIQERSCTTFIVAHRFSTIMNADLVVALEDGEIKEVGTHEELKRMNGIYARFLNLEQQGFLNEASDSAVEVAAEAAA